MASSWRRQSLIMHVMISFLDNTSPKFLRVEVYDVLKQRFTKDCNLCIQSWDIEFPPLDLPSADALEVPFSEEEIFNEFKDAYGE